MVVSNPIFVLVGLNLSTFMLTKITSNPFILLILAVLFWSGNFIVGRAVRDDIDPISLAFWRWTIAALVALYLSRNYIRHDLQEIRKHKFIMLVLSATGVASFNTLIYLGLQSTVAVNSLLMQSMIPVLTVVLSFALFKERLNLIQLVGVVISLLGVLTIISKGDYSLIASLEINLGDGLVFLAVICYSVYSVLLRTRPNVHPLSFVAASFVLGAVMLLPFYLIYAKSLLPPLTTPSISAILYVSLFPSIVSYLCYNRGVELAGANTASMFIHLMPLFGSLMAIAFLGESLFFYHLLGFFCIVGGIYFATKRCK